MYRRLGREDLAKTNPFLEQAERPRRLLWRVYEEYEVVDDEEALPYIRASGSEGTGTPQTVRTYNPLVDTPYLFLDFARIAERKNPGEALSQWIDKYGLMGFAYSYPEVGDEVRPQLVVPPREYDDRGGPGETLSAVWYEVRTANEMLTLYEAALNRDPENLELLLFPPDEESEWLEQRRKYGRELMRKSGASWTDVLIDMALGQVWEYVMTLGVFAYPAISTVGNLHERQRLTVDRLTASWGVRNLIGAMYLQFYWLITSAGELSRCKYCGRIISYAPPMPETGKRKPRKDKEFCSTSCRQNYHYHNRIKPSRQSERR